MTTMEEKQPNHLARIIAISVAISAVVDVLFITLVGPHVPPGRLTTTAADNQKTFNILFLIALPVLVGVWTFLAYSAVVWRNRPLTPEPIGGQAARSNQRAQVLWISITSIVVLALAVLGTVDVITGNGSGGGEGPNPVWSPAGATAATMANAVWTVSDNNVLPVQIIGQQWKFTYRYPTFGGFESQRLFLPANTTIAFHVTSLDVIHSFWAYQLDVKADANPMVDNVAFTRTLGTGSFTVRCSELCGIWHGSMFDYGAVMSKAAFDSWAKGMEVANAGNTKLLPQFAWTYVPDANGADGGYYPAQDPYSPVESYGAQNPVS